MRKFNTFVLIVVAMFIGISPVRAACEAAESNRLNGLAANVKASYVEEERILDPSEYTPPDGLSEEEAENYQEKYYIFVAHINNITEELYVVVKNDKTNESKTYRYSDAKDGTISFEIENIAKINNFTITVYSSDKTNCPNTKLYTTYLITPRYNEYSDYEACNGFEEFYLCHRYLAVESVSENSFFELVSQYQNGKINNTGEEVKNPEKNKGFMGFVKDHKVAIIITSIVIVAAGATVTVIIVKKQRSRII